MAGAGRGRRWTESSSSSRMQFHILQRQCDYSCRVHKSLVGPLDELASAPVHSPHTMRDEMFGRYRCVGPSLPSPIHLCSRFLIKQHVLEPLRACASVSVHRSFPSFPRSLLDDHPITSRIVGFARADSVLSRVRCTVGVAPSRSWSLRSTTPQSANALDSTPSIHLIFGLWTTDFKIKLGRIVPRSCSLLLWT